MDFGSSSVSHRENIRADVSVTVAWKLLGMAQQRKQHEKLYRMSCGVFY